MRARRIVAPAIALLLGLGVLATGCAGSSPAEPTLPSVNFSPKALIEIRPGELTFAKGPREDRDLLLDPPTFGSGTVTEIVNATTSPQRLQGNDGKVFDTGTMEPGQKTTVVFTNTTADPLTVTVTDTVDPNVRATIVVRPKPDA